MLDRLLGFASRQGDGRRGRRGGRGTSLRLLLPFDRRRGDGGGPRGKPYTVGDRVEVRRSGRPSAVWWAVVLALVAIVLALVAVQKGGS